MVCRDDVASENWYQPSELTSQVLGHPPLAWLLAESKFCVVPEVQSGPGIAQSGGEKEPP